MCVFCIPEASTGRLRRAVPKISAKFSVPHGLPLNKRSHLLTRSESALPQLLIPLHFKSFISNAYKKPGERSRRPTPKFCNSSLPTQRSCVHAETPATPFGSYIYFITRGQAGGWGIPAAGQICLSVALRPSRNTGHGPQVTTPLVPLRRNPQSARITVVSGLATSRETSTVWLVSKQVRADIGFGNRRVPFPVASRSQWFGAALARRPGSNVLKKHFNVDLLAGWSGQASNRAGKAGSVRMGQRPFLGPR